MKKSFKDDFDLNVIAESGQCFRFNQTGENTFQVVALGKVLTIKDMGQNAFDFDCSSDDYKKICKSNYYIKTYNSTQITKYLWHKFI